MRLYLVSIGCNEHQWFHIVILVRGKLQTSSGHFLLGCFRDEAMVRNLITEATWLSLQNHITSVTDRSLFLK